MDLKFVGRETSLGKRRAVAKPMQLAREAKKKLCIIEDSIWKLYRLNEIFDRTRSID